MDISDANLLSDRDGEASDAARETNVARAIECVVSVFRIGIQCSSELPTDRMDMGDVINELYKIRDALSRS